MSNVASCMRNVCFSWNGHFGLSASKRTLFPLHSFKGCALPIFNLELGHPIYVCISLQFSSLWCVFMKVCSVLSMHPQIDTKYQDDNKKEVVLAKYLVDSTRCQ